MNPCIPSSWPAFSIEWRVGATRYSIEVENPERRCRGVASVELDGAPVDPSAIPLLDDGLAHRVRVVLGTGPAADSGAGTVPAQVATDSAVTALHTPVREEVLPGLERGSRS